jgi:hypothetical protein
MAQALILCMSTATADAAPAPVALPLDTVALHFTYLDGDFDPAIARLEACLAAKSLRTHSDSVFAFKHLGVMYAARESTREKGKYYMLKLLEVEPTAKILDMYASDMIYMIFKNISDEFEAKRNRLGQARPVAGDSGKAGSVKPRKGRAWWWVGLGGAVAVAGAGIAYSVLAEEPAAQPGEHHDVK